MSELVDALDVHLAWQRIRKDHRTSRCFATHPCEPLLIEDVLDAWLSELHEEIGENGYHPSSVALVDVPKGAGSVRPGSLLSLRDEVVYTALVGAALPALAVEFSWDDLPPDQSYRLLSVDRVEWTEDRIKGWKRFRERSLGLIREGINYVVITDVVGCYENISLRRLLSDLRDVGVPEPVVMSLTEVLNRWSTVGGRGIPQGYTASDLLAKLYLTRVDRALKEQGYRHLRYVDDFRLFCESRAEAKRALQELQRILRPRGLNIQSKKTHLLRSAEALAEIEGVFQVLLPVVARHKREVAELVSLDPVYSTEWELQAALAASGNAPPTEVLRSAYQAHFMDPGAPFNPSLFHYLLNRLGAAEDPFAFVHVMGLLDVHPEETSSILDYVGAVGHVDSADPIVLRYVESDDAVYAYQHYQVIKWRASFDFPPPAELTSYVRRVEDSARTPRYLRAATRMFLGKFGSSADLERMEQRYAEAVSDQERAELICAVARQERSRRNAFVNGVKSDGTLTHLAARRVLEGRSPWQT